MSSTLGNIKEKTLFWKDFWPTNFLIYRNRGDTFAPEIVPSARIKYQDRPNTHKMKTGERIPAVPLRYVMTGDDGTPWIHAVEADDDQIVIFKPDFSLESGVDTPTQSGKIDLDTDMDSTEIKSAFEDSDYDVVSFSVLENRDERLTFLAEEIKTAETKYRPSSLIRQYPQLTLVIGTSLAITILLYATSQEYGQWVPVLKQFSQSGFGEVVQNAIGSGTGGAPPGQ